jgi:hypothetical protein
MKNRQTLYLIMILAVHLCFPGFSNAEDQEILPNDKWGVLVLSDGTVVQGIINRTAIGYLVNMKSGKRAISAGQVHLHAKSKKSAYKNFSKRSSKNNIPVRLKLTHWCLKNRLMDEAGNELKAILILEPENSEAKNLLKQLEEMLNPNHPSHQLIASENSRKMNNPDLEKVAYLGNLSRKLAKNYSSRIQPILLNQCGNYSCHGSPKREFYLNPKTAKIRRYSNMNIKSVFKQINWEAPEESNLLTHHEKKQESKVGRFRGRSGKRQKELIQKWIASVVQFQAENETVQVKEKGVIVQVSSGSPIQKKIVKNTLSRSPKKITENPVLKKTLEKERVDPFSPEEFNRKYHDR